MSRQLAFVWGSPRDVEGKGEHQFWTALILNFLISSRPPSTELKRPSGSYLTIHSPSSCSRLKLKGSAIKPFLSSDVRIHFSRTDSGHLQFESRSLWQVYGVKIKMRKPWGYVSFILFPFLNLSSIFVCYTLKKGSMSLCLNIQVYIFYRGSSSSFSINWQRFSTDKQFFTVSQL